MKYCNNCGKIIIKKHGYVKIFNPGNKIKYYDIKCFKKDFKGDIMNCKLWKTCKSKECLTESPWSIEFCYALNKLEKEGVIREE